MALSVGVSANFERNLESIRCFFQEQGTPELFEELLTYLFETVITTLEHHPLMGSELQKMPRGSVEAGMLVERLRELLLPDASLR